MSCGDQTSNTETTHAVTAAASASQEVVMKPVPVPLAGTVRLDLDAYYRLPFTYWAGGGPALRLVEVMPKGPHLTGPASAS